MALLGGQIVFGTPVFGATAPTISISLSTLSPLDVTPGHFDSVSQTISVTTNNYTGYTSTLTNPTNSTDLVHTSDNTLVIPTITLPSGTTSIVSSDFTSGYGISTDNTSFQPLRHPIVFKLVQITHLALAPTSLLSASSQIPALTLGHILRHLL